MAGCSPSLDEPLSPLSLSLRCLLSVINTTNTVSPVASGVVFPTSIQATHRNGVELPNLKIIDITMVRGAFPLYRFSQSFRSIFLMRSNALLPKGVIISSTTSTQSQVNYERAAILDHNCDFLHVPVICQLKWNLCCYHFSAAIEPTISWQGSSHAILLNKLESSLKDHHADEAWEVFKDYKSLHGFPGRGIVSKLIIELCYASDSRWLQRAYDLLLVILKEKSDLLHYDFLNRLALALARAQMPIPASTVIRIMFEKEKFPSMDTLSMVFLHLVKTQIGTYIASEILIEVCECYLLHTEKHGSRVSKLSKLLTLNTMIFNLVLDACVRFGATLKAHKIIQDAMPQTGVIADADSIVIMALIHERNGQRDELKKLKEHVDRVSLDHHYQNFYDSLLSLQFKFNDIDAAAGVVLDLYRCQQSFHCSSPLLKRNAELGKTSLVPVGSSNLRDGLRIQIMPDLLQNDYVVGMRNRPELVNFVDGKLVVTHKALAKLINGYVREKRVGELSNVFVSIQKLGFPSEALNVSSDAIDACIELGWLETAHDILDDMESAVIPVRRVTYTSLLRAYCRGNRFSEAKVLIKQMRKASLPISLSDEQVISSCMSEDSTTISLSPIASMSSQESSLAKSLLRETKEESLTSPLVYDINSSIYFFCKAKMMEDALKAFRRMQRMKLQPTVQTFSHLVNGYSSLRMYREITILWGEIKRSIDEGVLAADRDLFDCLLWNFIRGGYFERVMEIIGYMTKHSMYVDKWKYKREFLKFHKDLYRTLKASKAKTEAQSNRLEHVRAFRRWVRIDH
ncbi:hypothetical protein AAC387_Pa08g2033 [Persea americana]